MSDHVEGIVAKITSKDTRNGGKIYNVCIEADGQDDEWFGVGFDQPEYQEGDLIEFDIEYNGDYANVDPKTVNILEEGEPKPKRNSRSSGGNSRGSSGRSSGSSSRSSSRSSSKPARNSSPARGTSKGKGKSDAPASLSKEEWAQKDKIIRRQACMNTAIALISSAVANELVALPTKKSDKLDAYIALCDEEAERLYNQYEEQVYGGGQKRSGSNSRNNQYDDDIPE